MKICKPLIACLMSLFFTSKTHCVLAQAKHVILISIDGLHPDMYLDQTWPAPNLRELIKTGVYADRCLSVFPSYTYPSHTAMLTGAMPARSGIYFNQPKNSNGEWNWFADAIKAPTLWKALKQNNKMTAAVEWPVSVGNDITWNIPEIWSDLHPDRITESRKYATKGLIEEIERNATGILDSVNMNDEAFSMDDNSGRMAAYIFRTKKPSFLAVHFAEVDGVEHDHGRDGDSVKLAVAAVDRAIGVIREAVKHAGLADSTTIIVVGDHGFSTIHLVMRPNMLIKSLPVRFLPAGGSAFLYHVRSNSSMDDQLITKSVIDSLNALPKKQRKLFRIVSRPELNDMGADSSAILALTAEPGLVFSGASQPAQMTNHGPGTKIQNSSLDGLFISTTGGHHGYDPKIPDMWTGFIASGSGIQSGQNINEMRVVDIAPLIAKLLGIQFNAPDGKLTEGILTF